jgi:hypothetical protein
MNCLLKAERVRESHKHKKCIKQISLFRRHAGVGWWWRSLWQPSNCQFNFFSVCRVLKHVRLVLQFQSCLFIYSDSSFLLNCTEIHTKYTIKYNNVMLYNNVIRVSVHHNSYQTQSTFIVPQWCIQP